MRGYALYLHGCGGVLKTISLKIIFPVVQQLYGSFSMCYTPGPTMV